MWPVRAGPTPDPFAPTLDEEEVAWNDGLMMWSQPIDVWIAPAPDVRRWPGDATAAEDDLGFVGAPPARDLRRHNIDETRFLAIERVSPGATVFELVRVSYLRPGYLARLATFLEVRNAGGVVYLSNDLSDPDPFPVDGVTVVWHLRFEELERTDLEAPFLTAAPANHIPTAHRVDMLPGIWDDMRYHWGQRPANKVARISRPGIVRLFAEFQGAGSTQRFRVGGQLGGWEGEK